MVSMTLKDTIYLVGSRGTSSVTSSMGKKFAGGIATKCFPSPRPAMTVKPMLCAREKNKAAKITQSSEPRSFIRLPLRYIRLATTTADISHVRTAHAMMLPWRDSLRSYTPSFSVDIACAAATQAVEHRRDTPCPV